MEGSGEQGGRVNVKGWQLHLGSLIENNTAKSQLEWILFKFTLPSAFSQGWAVDMWETATIETAVLFFCYLFHHRPAFAFNAMIEDPLRKSNSKNWMIEYTYNSLYTF